MQTLETTKTVFDLITTAAKDYSEKIFLKYEDEDVVTAVTYSQFVRESMGILHSFLGNLRWKAI